MNIFINGESYDAPAKKSQGAYNICTTKLLFDLAKLDINSFDMYCEGDVWHGGSDSILIPHGYVAYTQDTRFYTVPK